jgi:NAD(P)-dependent dehydrogenase (short-subunit alcohol dehydrogenase family)
MNPDRADSTAQEIASMGGEAFGWQMDVTNRFQVSGMIETTRERYDRLDILVHHAHVSPQGAILTMDEWDWRRTMDVNLTGAFFCAQLAGRVMADAGGGLIVLLFHPLAQIGPQSAAYVVTQAGVVGLANAFMSELVEQNVWVRPIQIESPKRTAWQVLEFAQKLKW